MKELPEKGSLRESILIHLWLQREQMENAQTFALLQTLIDKDKGIQAYEEYKKVRFPWIETSREADKMKQLARLEQEIRKGALSITPMRDERTQVRSRLKAKVIAVDEKKRAQLDKVYRQMGKVVPI
jgi:hypothetical protein